jgi:hypothetical protein
MKPLAPYLLCAVLSACAHIDGPVNNLDQAIAIANKACGRSTHWQGEVDGAAWRLSRPANQGGIDVTIDRATGKASVCSWYS